MQSFLLLCQPVFLLLSLSQGMAEPFSEPEPGRMSPELKKQSETAGIRAGQICFFQNFLQSKVSTFLQQFQTQVGKGQILPADLNFSVEFFKDRFRFIQRINYLRKQDQARELQNRRLHLVRQDCAAVVINFQN